MITLYALVYRKRKWMLLSGNLFVIVIKIVLKEKLPYKKSCLRWFFLKFKKFIPLWRNNGWSTNNHAFVFCLKWILFSNLDGFPSFSAIFYIQQHYDFAPEAIDILKSRRGCLVSVNVPLWKKLPKHDTVGQGSLDIYFLNIPEEKKKVKILKKVSHKVKCK